jgi:hypothetical protein
LISGEHSQTPNVRLQIHDENKLPGKFIYVPAGYRNFGPIFFKKNPEEPTEVLLSVWDEEANVERCLSRSAWYSSEEQRQAHMFKNIGPTAETLNEIGWSWSFAHSDNDNVNWASVADVDFVIARSFFVRSARAGSWRACNNLAVMMLRGCGRIPSPTVAVKLLIRADRLAQHRASQPLKHLSECYRTGFGVAPDSKEADHLEKLSQMAEKQQK